LSTPRKPARVPFRNHRRSRAGLPTPTLSPASRCMSPKRRTRVRSVSDRSRKSPFLSAHVSTHFIHRACAAGSRRSPPAPSVVSRLLRMNPASRRRQLSWPPPPARRRLLPTLGARPYCHTNNMSSSLPTHLPLAVPTQPVNIVFHSVKRYVRPRYLSRHRSRFVVFRARQGADGASVQCKVLHHSASMCRRSYTTCIRLI
jgi:hypothetical protein